MKIEILSFTGNLFKSDTVISITTTTKNGEITILKDHSSLVTVLVPSTINVRYFDNLVENEKNFAIGGGILEVSNSSVKVLIDMLVAVEDLDIDRAEEARKKALAMMEKYKDSKDKVDMERFIEAEDSLLKSIAQLKLSKIK